jgi:hypothetical protein
MSEPGTKHPTEAELQAYADGELSSPSQTGVAEHVLGCPACTRRLEQLGSLFSLIESMPDLALGKDLSGEVLRALPSELKRLPLLTMLEAVAAVALAVLGVPWLASSELGFDLGQALQGWGSSGLGQVDRLVAGLDTLAAGLGQGLQGLAAPGLLPSLPSIPASQLWLLGGSAAVLWAVGNGLLLRRSGIRRKERL